MLKTIALSAIVALACSLVAPLGNHAISCPIPETEVQTSEERTDVLTALQQTFEERTSHFTDETNRAYKHFSDTRQILIDNGVLRPSSYGIKEYKNHNSNPEHREWLHDVHTLYAYYFTKRYQKYYYSSLQIIAQHALAAHEQGLLLQKENNYTAKLLQLIHEFALLGTRSKKERQNFFNDVNAKREQYKEQRDTLKISRELLVANLERKGIAVEGLGEDSAEKKQLDALEEDLAKVSFKHRVFRDIFLAIVDRDDFQLSVEEYARLKGKEYREAQEAGEKLWKKLAAAALPLAP